MPFFQKKKEVDLEDFCRDFYEKNILNPAIEGVDCGAVYFDTIRKFITEADQNFTKVSSQNFTKEMIPLRFELFSLAWLHRFGDKFTVDQSVFTKKYLHERKRNDIWDNSEPYNQAIAHSSKLGKTLETASGRFHLVTRDTIMMDLFKKYCEECNDQKCVARAVNRVYADVAWKDGITAGFLMLAVCDRLGCELNKEAQFRLTTAIRGFYDGARQDLNGIKIKN